MAPRAVAEMAVDIRSTTRRPALSRTSAAKRSRLPLRRVGSGVIVGVGLVSDVGMRVAVDEGVIVGEGIGGRVPP